MRTGIIRGASLWLAATLLATGLAVAQNADPPPPEPMAPPTVEELQRQVEELTRQLQVVQEQLAQLKAQQDAQKKQAEIEDLKQAAAAEAAKAAAPDAVDTSTDFVSGTRMQAMLNPELSVTGDIFFVGGEHEKEEFLADHFELDIQSYLDPYTKMHVVIGYHGPHHESSFGMEEHDHEEEEHGHEGFGLEEGYVTWLQLPGHTSLTVGLKRQQFGVLNRWHKHALDQSDWPWVIQESFGPHGLEGTGVSFDWLMPRLWADTNELTVEIMNGNNDVAFAGSDWKKPTFLAYLKNYWDLSPNTYFEADLTALHGVTDHEGNFAHDFLALDLAYDWYPAGRELYRGFTARAMLLHSWLDLEDGGSLNAWGSYLYGQYRLSARWIAGLRWDWVEDQRAVGHDTWGLTPYLTLWQSEFVRLRGQATYENDNWYGTDRRFELQITFAAGPHKHESY
ncbi:MAG: FlxA-like family protein [Thermoanaerobaculales bacterium]|nr:FlxA-like family protein [Thermoanaerobaculales bacterium]